MRSFFKRDDKTKSERKPADKSASKSGASKLRRPGRRDESKERSEPSIDDLIVLGKLDEAEERLRKKLKSTPGDQHGRLKLAEVLHKKGDAEAAVEEYLAAADQLLRDGFLDRAQAVLLRAQRLTPINEAITQRVNYLNERRDLDKVRDLAVAALSSASRTATGSIATAAIELEQIWDRLSRTEFVRFLPGEQIAKVLSNMRLRRFGEKDVLVEANADRAMLLLVTFGQVEAVAVSEQGKRTNLRTFTIGDIIGESALLQHQKWPVELRANSSGSALVLEREGLEACLVGNADPRGLLQGLRRQGNDTKLREMISKLAN